MQKKKVAAALAAVQLYLQQEAEEEAEEAAYLPEPEPVSPARNIAIEPGQWAQSGRVDMMAGRRLIQLRAFSNAR
ncbi:hypothetical protein [Propionivibrio sp.]|uniref:hypothetical protein n=1 Tax=Propionivibrio sp. TaxID=2212460 RepID=UPI00262A01F4|nr:hypothetical protein [Propionivibrio sp.]